MIAAQPLRKRLFVRLSVQSNPVKDPFMVLAQVDFSHAASQAGAAARHEGKLRRFAGTRVQLNRYL